MEENGPITHLGTPMPLPTRAVLIPTAARRACRAVILLHLVTLAACDHSPTATDLGEGPAAAGPRISADAVPGVSNGKIAFVGLVAFDSEIFTIESDGSGLTRLTNHAGTDEEPAWSPDGTRIVFRRNVTNPDGGLQSDIYLMNADGSGQVSLTSGPDLDGRPAWSPDGTKIAFDRNSGGNQDIYVMNADGSAPTRLTDDEEPDMEPAWSPDGTRIVFVSLRDDPGDEFSKADIFVMNADGTGVTNLTSQLGADHIVFDSGWAR